MKKFLSRLLVFFMVVSMLPMNLRTVSATEPTEVTLSLQAGHAQSSSNRYLIYLNVEGIETTGGSNDYYNGNTAMIDGKKITSNSGGYIQYYDPDTTDGVIALIVYYSKFEEDGAITKPHTLVIPAGTVIGKSVPIEVKNDIGFKVTASSVTQMQVAEVSLDTETPVGVQDASTRYLVYFNLSGATATKDIYYYYNTLKVDGTLIEGKKENGINWGLISDTSKLRLILGYSVVQEGATSYTQIGEHIIDIPAGSMIGCNSNGNQGGDIIVKNTVRMKVKGSSFTQIEVPDEEEVELALNTAETNSGSSHGIYLTTPDSMPVSGWTTNIFPNSGSGDGVFLNGTKTNAFIRKYTTGKYYVCLADVNIIAEAGDKVTVQGEFTFSDYTVSFNPFTAMFDGTKWVTCYSITPIISAGEGLNFYTYDAKGNEITEPSAYNMDGSVTYAFTQGGISYNGNVLTEEEVTLAKVKANLYSIVFGGSYATPTAGDEVVLDGTIQSNEAVVSFTRTTFVYDEGGTWTGTEGVVCDKTFTMNVEPEYCSIDGDLTLVFSTSTGVFGQPEEAIWSGLTILLQEEGVESSVNLGKISMIKDNRGMLRATIPEASIPEDNYMVTVKIGVLQAEETGFDYDASTETMYLSKDCTAYVNQYGVGNGKCIVKGNSTDADEELALDVANSSSTTLAFTLPSANTLSNSTSADIKAADEESGVFINGIRYPEIAMTKSAGVLTVDLSSYGNLTAGDHVMILGTLERTDEFVTIAPTAVSWDGSAWSSASVSGVTAEYVLDITDDEQILEGREIRDAAGNSISQRVFYQAGDYELVRVIGDVEIGQRIILYRANDMDEDGKYSAKDIVKMLKYEQISSYADTLTKAEIQAALNGSLASLKAEILETGKTKADAALPVEMVGPTNPGGNAESKYITSVDATTSGTTVISMSETENGYATVTDYDAYGFDYVIDINTDRELKVLQLTDTQIIDSAQERTEERLDSGSEAVWATDQMDKVLFDVMRDTIAQTNPDLILVTGDLIYGEFDDAGTSFLKLIEVMDSFRIPWAPVYGNHENESKKGVVWQNEQLVNSTYCLFNPRHEIGGNGNYSIGLSRNGSLERVVYMLDSNYCSEAPKEDIENGNIIPTPGFTDAQLEWYRSLALRVNTVAGKTIPSIVGFHVPPKEILLGAKAACYQEGDDSSAIQYTIGKDNVAQDGDTGFKKGGFGHLIASMSDLMNEVGSDGAFFGHVHLCSTSISYAGIRWTFGLKTGAYDASPSEQGGTLISFENNGADFTVEHINVK